MNVNTLCVIMLIIFGFITREHDTAEVMKSLNIPKGVRRVLFRTLNTDR